MQRRGSRRESRCYVLWEAEVSAEKMRENLMILHYNICKNINPTENAEPTEIFQLPIVHLLLYISENIHRCRQISSYKDQCVTLTQKTVPT